MNDNLYSHYSLSRPNRLTKQDEIQTKVEGKPDHLFLPNELSFNNTFFNYLNARLRNSIFIS